MTNEEVISWLHLSDYVTVPEPQELIDKDWELGWE